MTDSVATLRLLAKCGSMDLSALGPIADEMERLQTRLKSQSEYAIQLQRLIESHAHGHELPYPELHHHRLLKQMTAPEPSEPLYRKWPGEPPHCMSCSCGMTDDQKRTVPEADYLRVHRELMELKYPGVTAPPVCPHGVPVDEVCPECAGAPSDNPDDEIAEKSGGSHEV